MTVSEPDATSDAPTEPAATPGEPRSEPSAPAAPATEPEPLLPPRRKRSRARVAVVALVVVAAIVVLLLLAAVVVEGIARSRAAGEVEERMRVALGLDADAEIDATVAADRPLLLQLAGGSLDRVEIEVPRFEAQGLVGDLGIVAEGVPLDEGGAIATLDVEYAIAEEDLGGIAGSLSGLDADSITLEEPEILVATAIEIIGIEIPLTVGLEPGVDRGALTFDPTTLRLGDDTVSVADLRSNPLLAGFASAVLQQREVCVAAQLPAALTVLAARVDGDELVITMNGDGAVLADLGTTGECPATTR